MPETSFWLSVLTGGGDCAGINAALRAVTKSLIQEHNASVLAIRDGFRSRNPAIEPSTRAASLVAERRFGKMVALQDGSFTDVPLSTVANARRTVPLGSSLIASTRSVSVSFGVQDRDDPLLETDSTSFA